MSEEEKKKKAEYNKRYRDKKKKEVEESLCNKSETETEKSVEIINKNKVENISKKYKNISNIEKNISKNDKILSKKEMINSFIDDLRSEEDSEEDGIDLEDLKELVDLRMEKKLRIHNEQIQKQLKKIKNNNIGWMEKEDNQQGGFWKDLMQTAMLTSAPLLTKLVIQKCVRPSNISPKPQGSQLRQSTEDINAQQSLFSNFQFS